MSHVTCVTLSQGRDMTGDELVSQFNVVAAAACSESVVTCHGVMDQPSPPRDLEMSSCGRLAFPAIVNQIISHYACNKTQHDSHVPLAFAIARFATFLLQAVHVACQAVVAHFLLVGEQGCRLN